MDLSYLLMLITFKLTIHSFVYHTLPDTALVKLMSDSAQSSLWLISCNPALHFLSAHISPGLDHVCTFLAALFDLFWDDRRVSTSCVHQNSLVIVLQIILHPYGSVFLTTYWLLHVGNLIFLSNTVRFILEFIYITMRSCDVLSQFKAFLNWQKESFQTLKFVLQWLTF